MQQSEYTQGLQSQMAQKYEKDAAHVDMDEKEFDYNRGYLERIKDQKADMLKELQGKGSDGVAPLKTHKKIMPKPSNTKSRVIETTPTKGAPNKSGASPEVASPHQSTRVSPRNVITMEKLK